LYGNTPAVLVFEADPLEVLVSGVLPFGTDFDCISFLELNSGAFPLRKLGVVHLLKTQ
jgi:hypothetical protein